MTLTAVIRTAAQAAAAWLIGIAWIADLVAALNDAGLEINATVLEGVIFTGLLAIITALVNWAGQRWPWVNKVFSFGRSTASANY